MPTLLRWKGYRFFFYSADGWEPAPVHVVKDGHEAKLWLDNLSVAVNPRLIAASVTARNVIELLPMGVHWPEIDEDISVASMLRGQKAPGAKLPSEAA